MKNHTKVYMQHFNIIGDEFIGCECCGARAVDIHHINARGMGGSKGKDDIDNLMAVCRDCHTKYGDAPKHLDYLIKRHKIALNKIR
jgi:hypothetical protein